MIYVLYGTDSFSLREALSALKSELDVDGMLQSNTVAFDARQATPQEVFAACDTAPFFGERRLVILEGALRLARAPGRGRSRRKVSDPDGERGAWWALVEYAGRMPEQTVLVLLDGESIDKDLLDALRPMAEVKVLSLPGQREVARWVQGRARARGLKIDGRGCAAIAELVGNNTWILASEIDKLAAYAGGDTLNEQDIKALVTDVREREGYLLADAVAEGKAAVATRLLHQMLAKGRPLPVLLLTIESRYRRIAAAREMMDAGESGTRIGARLGVTNPYGLDRLLEQASRYPMARVREALDRIAQADHDVKQGLRDEELALEILVQELASPGAAVRAK